MEQPETPQDPVTPAEPAADPAAKPQLPDHKHAFPIPDQFRLPFHGKMVAPTAVPSAMERAYRMNQEQKRRRRRGFLLGLLAGQVLIIAGVALIYAGMAVRALFGRKRGGVVAAAGGGIKRVILTVFALAVSIS